MLQNAGADWVYKLSRSVRWGFRYKKQNTVKDVFPVWQNIGLGSICSLRDITVGTS